MNAAKPNAATPQDYPRDIVRESLLRMIEDRLKSVLEREHAPGFVGVPASAGLEAPDMRHRGEKLRS